MTFHQQRRTALVLPTILVLAVLSAAFASFPATCLGATLTPAEDTDGDGLLDGWEYHYFGELNDPRSNAAADPDFDGHSNRFEFYLGLNPLKTDTRFRLWVDQLAGGQPPRLGLWPVFSGRSYLVEATDSLLGTWQPVASNGPIDDWDRRFVTDSQPAGTSRFYRVTAALPVRLQRFNLTSVPAGGHFTPLPTDLVWPQNIGEGVVCLWADDKFAALTITIDDNTAPDHAWWLQQAQTYQIPLTWFIVTSRVNGSNTFHGTWNGFQTLVNAGHSVQSHSVTHGASSISPPPPEAEYVTEYDGSRSAIFSHLTGQPVDTLAYPGGTCPPNPTLASRYYLGARGTGGTPNTANKINYLNTASTSGGISPDYVNPLLSGTAAGSTPTWLNNNSFRRGWLCSHFHQVQASAKPGVISNLEYIYSKRDLLWIATFRDVVRYGQERDTKTLTVRSVGANSISFELSDQMLDAVFDFPLTIKFRVPSTWSSVSATQFGGIVPAWLVDHQGARYALVKAVPDRGVVLLTNGANL